MSRFCTQESRGTIQRTFSHLTPICSSQMQTSIAVFPPPMMPKRLYPGANAGSRLGVASLTSGATSKEGVCVEGTFVSEKRKQTADAGGQKSMRRSSGHPAYG